MNGNTNVPTMPVEDQLRLLRQGKINAPKLIPYGSNYTFLATLEEKDATCQAIYKPRSGERPLWDFPQGTLYKREYAAYVVSQALGWPRIPPTVIREGPSGLGSLQLYVLCDPGANYFTLRDTHVLELQCIATFDLLVNNADRKGGHCLLGNDGAIWSIDHGLTFHAMFKLRTVIWDFCGEPIPKELLHDLEVFLTALGSPSSLSRELASVLAPEEIQCLAERGHRLVAQGMFPPLDPHRNIPYPWI